MARWTLLSASVALLVCQTGALAFCPSGYPNELFCEDFDTYCDTGGMPGGAGVPVGTKCPSGTTKTPSGIDKMRTVWYPTSIDDLLATACGVPITMVDMTVDSPFPLPYSAPFAGSNPAEGREGIRELMGQVTFRDWALSEPPPGNQVLNLGRFIGNAFGEDYSEVVGTDANPLVMTFMVDTLYWENNSQRVKIFYSAGYVELAKGDASDPMNRVNTDFTWSPNCATYCSPAINQGPFQIMCAQGVTSPYGPLPAACPVVTTNPPPVRNAIGLGLMTMLDNDPCHCGVQAHGPINYHPGFFDGRMWWMLRTNNPVSSGGTVTDLNGNPVTPPAEISKPGNFTLWGPFGDRPTYSTGPYNWLTMTIKTNTVKLEMEAIESDKGGTLYRVYNVMDNVPRGYLGSFDTVRMGVGAGCELQAGTWDCKTGTDRTCLLTLNNNSRAVNFDDLSISGGSGYSVNGACCLADASCVDDMTEEDCEAMAGGRWQGSSTTCANTTCCPYPFADGDHDGDVDQEDFGLFQLCYTDTGGGVPTGCDCFDRVEDGSIDINDFLAFGNCYTGANVLYSANPPAQCTP